MGIDHTLRDEPADPWVTFARLDRDGALTVEWVGTQGRRESRALAAMSSAGDPQATARRRWATTQLRGAGWAVIGPQWYTTPEHAEVRLVTRPESEDGVRS